MSINCIYCSKHLLCLHPIRKKFLCIFRRKCGKAYGQLSMGQSCLIQKRFSEPDLRRIERRLKLVTTLEICINCQSYNENWEKERNQEQNWCKVMSVEEQLNDKESEKLGYCKCFASKYSGQRGER